MDRIWVNRAKSFKDAEKFDEDYYLNMTGSERLEIIQYLRETYFKIKRGKKNENRKGLRRSVKVIQQEITNY